MTVDVLARLTTEEAGAILSMRAIDVTSLIRLKVLAGEKHGLSWWVDAESVYGLARHLAN
jgi:hypothetical protein